MLKHQPSKMQPLRASGKAIAVAGAVLLDHRPRPGQSAKSLRIGNPYLGSIWLTHSLDGRVQGLKNTPRDLQPRMAWCSMASHHVCLAMVMFAVGVASLWLRFRGKLFSSRWFLWILAFMTPSRNHCGRWRLVCRRDWTAPWVITGS